MAKLIFDPQEKHGDCADELWAPNPFKDPRATIELFHVDCNDSVLYDKILRNEEHGFNVIDVRAKGFFSYRIILEIPHEEVFQKFAGI